MDLALASHEIFYLIIVNLFALSYFHLSNSPHQFLFLFLYFILETIMGGALFFFSKKKKKNSNISKETSEIDSIPLEGGPSTPTDIESCHFSSSDFNPNATRTKPFIGVRWYSFSLIAFLDAISKLSLFGGLAEFPVGKIFHAATGALLVTIISFFFYKNREIKKINAYSFIGGFLSLTGCSILIVTFIFNGIDISISGDNIFPFLCLIFSQIIQITQYFIQDYNAKKNSVESFRTVFLEGVFGIVISGGLLIAAFFIECEERYKWKCNNSYFESWFVMPKDKKNFLIFCGCTAFSFCFYNLSGVIVGKRTYVTCRVIIENCSLIGLLVVYSLENKYLFKDYKYYIGLGIVFLGAFIGCEFIRLPKLKTSYEIDKAFPEESKKDELLFN